MSDEIIVTLLAERGRKFEENGEAIASYLPTEGGKHRFASIVFLPKGTQPEKKYRVRLKVVGTDKADQPMYRGLPAPVEYTERWKDNGDGTLSLVTFALSWKLEESEEGERERRPKVTRNRLVSTHTSSVLRLGTDKASSFVEDTPVEVWWSESEGAADGVIVWQLTAEREMPQTALRYAVERLVAVGDSEWWQHRFEKNWRAAWTMAVEAVYRRADGEAVKLAVPVELFVDLPRWCRQELEAEYPLCSCGRVRVEAAGMRACESCTQMTVQRQVIDEHLPAKRKQKLAAEAVSFLAGVCMESADGEMLLRELTVSLPSGSVSSEYLGFPWYYRTESRIVGSKFSLDALELLTRLPDAQGDGLVRLVVWLANGIHRAGLDNDYFFRTQVKGEVVPVPGLTAESVSRASVAVCLIDLAELRANKERRAARAAAEAAVEARRTVAEKKRAKGGTLRGDVGGNHLRRIAQSSGAKQTDEGGELSEFEASLTGLFGGNVRVRSAKKK